LGFGHFCVAAIVTVSHGWSDTHGAKVHILSRGTRGLKLFLAMVIEHMICEIIPSSSYCNHACVSQIWCHVTKISDKQHKGGINHFAYGFRNFHPYALTPLIPGLW
jgi:hypothetical protein